MLFVNRLIFFLAILYSFSCHAKIVYKWNLDDRPIEIRRKNGYWFASFYPFQEKNQDLLQDKKVTVDGSFMHSNFAGKSYKIEVTYNTDLELSKIFSNHIFGIWDYIACDSITAGLKTTQTDRHYKIIVLNTMGCHYEWDD